MPIHTPSTIEAIVDVPISRSVGQIAALIASDTGWLSKVYAEIAAERFPDVVRELLGQRQVEAQLRIQGLDRRGRHLPALLRQELGGIAEPTEQEEVEG